MSERPIQVGDLVIVVQVHCSASQSIGKIYQVTGLIPKVRPICAACRKFHGPCDLATFYKDPADGKTWAAPLSWLKRIPPLSDLESEQHNEELTA